MQDFHAFFPTPHSDVVASVEEHLVSVFCTSSSQVEAKEQKDLAPLSHHVASRHVAWLADLVGVWRKRRGGCIVLAVSRS